jgi:hypothetical protein
MFGTVHILHSGVSFKAMSLLKLWQSNKWSYDAELVNSTMKTKGWNNIQTNVMKITEVDMNCTSALCLL